MSTIYLFCDRWDPEEDPCQNFTVTDTATDDATWNSDWEVDWECDDHERSAERYVRAADYNLRLAEYRRDHGFTAPVHPAPTQHHACQACFQITDDPFNHLLINQGCFTWMNAITTTRRWGNFLPRTPADTPDWVAWRDVCSAWNTPSRSGHPNPRTQTQEATTVPTFRSTWAP
jgi:hypothetical protein